MKTRASLKYFASDCGRACFFFQFGLRDLFAMYIFRTPAKKFRLGENADHMLALIGKTQSGEAATGGVL